MASSNRGHEDFYVTLAASACVILQDHQTGETAPHVIHAVSVTQPAQSWTVLRDHIDFLAMDMALSGIVSDLPSCAPAHKSSPDDVDAIIFARNSAQEWLSSVLTVMEVRESPVMRQFLCYGANVVPPQFEGLAWVDFTQQPSSTAGTEESTTSPSSPLARSNSNSQLPSSISRPNLDEMEMDDMFLLDDEPQSKHDDDNDNDDDGNSIDTEDDTDYLQGRYVPTEEDLTELEIMEIQQDYKQVEMVEDVGSLAQSMGASHLGRSLNLQKEVGFRHGQQQQPQQQMGINIVVKPDITSQESKQESKSSAPGGIGGAMANAEQYPPKPQQPTQAHVKEIGDSFHRTVPISAPRLDSFQMIKVIGKGSFGEFPPYNNCRQGCACVCSIIVNDALLIYYFRSHPPSPVCDYYRQGIPRS